MIHYTAIANGLRLHEVVDAIDAGGAAGALEILDAGGVVLATCALSYPCEERVLDDAITFAKIWPASVTTAGTAALARIKASDGTIVVSGLTVTGVGGGGNIELTSIALTTDRAVLIDNLSIEELIAPISTLDDVRLNIAVSPTTITEGETATWSVTLSGHALLPGETVSYVLTPTGGQAADFPTDFDTTMQGLAIDLDNDSPGWGSYDPATNTVTITQLAPNPISFTRTLVIDAFDEGTETFTVTASSLSSGAIETGAATLTVLDSLSDGTTPASFVFTDVTGATASTTYVSNTITLSGTTANAPISVTGGEYQINGGAWTSASGTIAPGSTFAVRGTSAATANTTVGVVLTIGGVSDTFSIQTADTQAPVLSSSYYSGAIITLVFDETLDGTSVPATDRFAVTDDGAAATVSSVGLSGTSVTVTLSAPVADGSTVAITYTAGANPIRDVAGNAAAGFTIASVPGASGTLASSVSQYGITFNFSEPRTVGQYANGDWWVVGPVTITSITPQSYVASGTFSGGAAYSNRVVHGTMINPGNRSFVGGSTAANTEGSFQGYDGLPSATHSQNLSVPLSYTNSFNVDPGRTGAPLVLEEGTVVKSISNMTPPTTGRMSLTDTVPLTVVRAAPAPGAFRPPIAVADKSSPWNESQIDMSILPKLATPPAAISFVQAETDLRRMHQVQFTDNVSGSRNISPTNNQPEYGRDIGKEIGDALLLLCCNYPDAQKRDLMIYMIQNGLDVYGRIVEGGRFRDNGGGNMRHKMPMVLAGLALNDTAVATAGDFPHFQEDTQTFYVQQSDVDTPRAYDANRQRDPFTQQMIGMAEWGEKHYSNPARSGSNWNASYRDVNFAVFMSHALAAHYIPGARSAWNYEQFFEYCDRVWGQEKSESNFWTNHFTLFAWQMWKNHREDVINGAPTQLATTTLPASGIIYVNFNRQLDELAQPAAGDFAVTINGASQPISSVQVWGDHVAITMGGPFASGAAIAVAYSPGATPLRDVFYNNVGAF